MHDNTARVVALHGTDWKALGYITSIVSVFFLGCAAWLKESPPWWYHPALIVGMTTSILGMGFRYKSHLDEQREISKAQEEAENKPRGTRSPKRAENSVSANRSIQTPGKAASYDPVGRA